MTDREQLVERLAIVLRALTAAISNRERAEAALLPAECEFFRAEEVCENLRAEAEDLREALARGLQ